MEIKSRQRGGRVIYNEKEFDEDFKERSEGAMILSEGDAFSESYGMNFVLLTDEHIKALQEGKALCVYINCEEYSCLLKKEVEE